MKRIVLFVAICLQMLFLGGCDENNPVGTLVLTADKESAIVGTEKITFTVAYNGVDITAITVSDTLDISDTVDVSSGLEIYYGTQKIEGNVFTAAIVGDMKFTAKYKDAFSNDLVIEGLSGNTFLKNSIMFVFTSASCKICPYMTSAVAKVTEMYKERIAVMSFHTDFEREEILNQYDLYDPYKLDYTGHMEWWTNAIGGYPKASIDADFLYAYTYDPKDIETISLKKEVKAGQALETTIDGTTLNITVKTTLLEDMTSYDEVAVAVWLIENNLPSNQLMPDGNITNEYNNLYVVRKNITPMDGNTIGELIPADKKVANAETTNTYSVDIKDYKAENLEVISYIYNVKTGQSGNGRWVRNSQKVKAGENQPYQYINEK